MIDNQRLDSAQNYLRKAQKLQLEGKIDQAIDYYMMSIDLFPTAEAHTALGWAYSMQGRFEEAIDECFVAIDIDESYGNPYNDIGSYLISLERYDDAIEWFERAIDAPRYNQRHLPLFNLGRVYEKKGDWFKALKFYNDTLKIDTEFEEAKLAIIRLTTLLN